MSVFLFGLFLLDVRAFAMVCARMYCEERSKRWGYDVGSSFNEMDFFLLWTNDMKNTLFDFFHSFPDQFYLTVL